MLELNNRTQRVHLYIQPSHKTADGPASGQHDVALLPQGWWIRRKFKLAISSATSVSCAWHQPTPLACTITRRLVRRSGTCCSLPSMHVTFFSTDVCIHLPAFFRSSTYTPHGMCLCCRRWGCGASPRLCMIDSSDGRPLDPWARNPSRTNSGPFRPWTGFRTGEAFQSPRAETPVSCLTSLSPWTSQCPTHS